MARLIHPMADKIAVLYNEPLIWRFRYFVVMSTNLDSLPAYQLFYPANW